MKKLLCVLLFLAPSFAFSYPKECEGMENDFSYQRSKFHARHLKDMTLFVGSSSIRMWRNIDKHFDELYNENGKRNYYNRGFGGSQICHLLIHYKELFLGDNKKQNPKRVVIYSGDNDLNNLYAQEIVNHYKLLVSRLRLAGLDAPIYIVSTKPSVARAGQKDEIRKIAELLKSQVHGNDKVQVVDSFDYFFGADGKIKKHYFLEDGLHLRPVVYKEWARRLEELF